MRDVYCEKAWKARSQRARAEHLRQVAVNSGPRPDRSMLVWVTLVPVIGLMAGWMAG